MNPLRFFAGLLILLLALFAQIFFASAGIFLNSALAALIAFAFVFTFWELAVFDLLAVFVLTWQPAPSLALIVFALVPLAAFVFCKLTQWHGWTGTLIAIVVGLAVFYIAGGGTPYFFAHFGWFALDVVIAAAVGELIVVGLA